MKSVIYLAFIVILSCTFFVGPCLAETPQQRLMRYRACYSIVASIGALGCFEEGGWSDICEAKYRGWIDKHCYAVPINNF